MINLKKYMPIYNDNIVTLSAANYWCQMYVKYELPYKIKVINQEEYLRLPRWVYDVYAVFYDRFTARKTLVPFGQPFMFEYTKAVYDNEDTRLRYSTLRALDDYYNFKEDLEKDFPELWAINENTPKLKEYIRELDYGYPKNRHL